MACIPYDRYGFQLVSYSNFVRKTKKTVGRPHAGSGVVRIDPLCFLAGCRTRQLNQALSVLSLSLGFF